jgi:exonuclease 3'-5' domain-containing protein 1
MAAPHYVLVSTTEAIEQAVAALASSGYLIVDCEARELGMVGGALSLISIGTARAEQVFLFDALSPALAPGSAGASAVLGLLERITKPKVVWDGRMDYVELLATYGIRMQNVLDLQLVEVITARTLLQGYDEQKRLNRLLRFFPSVKVFGRQYSRFPDIHLLAGLSSCIREYKLGDGLQKNRESMTSSLSIRSGPLIFT